ncbi:acyl-phosphate glycerol 3-phosphate acyltransferase [Jonquetella anthropi DSM 22815]|uniref:Glycerol-3-phosphate acyltransferase n=1 Tax=Jonquetella anthropi DSM 22815 TaxID=885272 RepID=H0UJM4_9BACT|nr:glycerol-3-phosphate 1-O-acyltransferase PlsY [Jonquetella anthropi]EEX48878.1 acyl-phosphate glycerol 3-phosphate acyltransferase [Jonquetella anthropi E3_33 E1]EHM12892.1 acyl-phosphate glycerol 3-phosphate acyltransferase [Jonquetella anthropi DSM 22815]
MNFSLSFLWLALAYLIGSIPTGYLSVRLVRGIDIRTFGSGNTGGTNVGRLMGRKWGVGVIVFDMLKGALVIGLFRLAGLPNWLVMCGALAAVLGHNYPIWLGFRGGKGVATTFGTLFFCALPWSAAAIALAGVVWGLCLYLWRMVSLASLIALTAAPVLLALAKVPAESVWLGVCLALLAFWRHRSNVGRIMRGTENRIGQK